MLSELNYILIGIDFFLFVCFFLFFLTARKERLRREELTHKMDKMAEMLGEMVQLNESAFRNMSRTVRALENGIQKTEKTASPSSTEKKHRILSLLSRGLAVDEIIQRLNVPRGEVELIANLGSMMLNENNQSVSQH